MSRASVRHTTSRFLRPHVTREAAREGFRAFIGDAVDATYREFNVVAALQGAHTPGSGTIDRLLKQSDALDRRYVGRGRRSNGHSRGHVSDYEPLANRTGRRTGAARHVCRTVAPLSLSLLQAILSSTGLRRGMTDGHTIRQ